MRNNEYRETDQFQHETKQSWDDDSNRPAIPAFWNWQPNEVAQNLRQRWYGRITAGEAVDSTPGILKGDWKK